MLLMNISDDSVNNCGKGRMLFLCKGNWSTFQCHYIIKNGLIRI